MISTLAAEALILSNVFSSLVEKISLHEINQHVLRENIYTDRDYPPFDRVMMDGIAVSSQSGPGPWKTQAIQKAGEPAKKLEGINQCIEIMTGACLPAGTDAVVRYEDVCIENGQAFLKADFHIVAGANIHKKGADCLAKALVIAKGCELNAPELAALASVGCSEISVSKVPKVAIVSTGDELVAVHERPEPYQIRLSNPYALLATLKSYNFTDSTVFRVQDSLPDLEDVFKKCLLDFDVVIISGGVSAGKFDFVPTVLKELGVREIFHKVKQKPGKPLWFGVSKQNKLVFGLPGNPQSSLICFCRYVLPALLQMAKVSDAKKIFVKVCGPEHLKPTTKVSLTRFLPVRIDKNAESEFGAEIIAHKGSGDFMNLIGTQGFIEVLGNREFKYGDYYPLYLWQKGL